jgi:RNA polymerase sigma factor (sigma-70 family)
MLTADGKTGPADVAWRLSRESRGIVRISFFASSSAYEGMRLQVSSPVFNQEVVFRRSGMEGISADAIIPLSAISTSSDLVVAILSREDLQPTNGASWQTVQWKISLGDLRTSDHSLPVPDDVQTIFKKPGVTWTNAEREAVEAWFAERPQLHYSLCTLVSKGADAMEAEDILQEFWEKRLRDVLRKYDPSKGKPMPGYLMMNLAFYCQDCLKRKKKRETTWPSSVGEEGDIEFDVADDTAMDAESLLSARQKRRLLLDSIRCLKLDQRTAVVRHYFEGVPIKTIARDMNKGEENVKIILYRARRHLAMRLRACGGLA